MAAAAGCVVSVQPLLDDAGLIADARLPGTWEDVDGSARVVISSAPEDGRQLYRVEYTADGRIGVFEGRLGHLGERIVLEIRPAPEADDLPEPYSWLLVPAHMLMVLELHDGEAVSWQLDADSLGTALSTGPLAARAYASGDQLVLQGPPEDLRAALTPLLERPGMLRDRTAWRRVLAPQP